VVAVLSSGCVDSGSGSATSAEGDPDRSCGTLPARFQFGFTGADTSPTDVPCGALSEDVAQGVIAGRVPPSLAQLVADHLFLSGRWDQAGQIEAAIEARRKLLVSRGFTGCAALRGVR
jgi:hypothetical protein